MFNSEQQRFIDLLEGLSPRCKLFYFFNLFEDKFKYDLATGIAPYFYQLAIDNGLIGCFNKITNLLSIYCSKGSTKEPGELSIKRK